MLGCLWRIVIMLAAMIFMGGFIYGYIWLVLNGVGPFVDFLNSIPLFKRLLDHFFTSFGAIVFAIVVVLSGIGVIDLSPKATR